MTEYRIRCDRCGREWTVTDPDNIDGHLCAVSHGGRSALPDRDPAPVSRVE